MTASTAFDYRPYLRPAMMPHILCPGCGHGIVLKALLRAVHGLGLGQDDVVFVSGIGCSSRLVGYVDFCTLHTTHGRPLTFATGLRLARPDLKVVVITGDGDGLAIGGNHLIHAARRNIDLTCLLLNNATYGMTGGQGAPTTPEGARSSTGSTVEPAFDACRLATGAGATFVARGMTSAPLGLDALIAEAIAHRGFSFVEILSDCPEYFGRYNALGRGPEMLQAQRRRTEHVDRPLRAKRSLAGRDPAGVETVPGGVLHREERPEFGAVLAAAGGAPGARDNGSCAIAPGAPPSPGPGVRGDFAVRLAGAGGQGIVLAGLILAEAAVAAGRNATHAQAYGPESRGGASRAEVLMADGEIDYPCADRVDALLALTQQAADQYGGQMASGGVVITDADRVTSPPPGATVCALPLAATAQRALGVAVGTNLVGLGALVARTRCVPAESVECVLAARRPGGSADRALAAFRAGLALVAASSA